MFTSMDANKRTYCSGWRILRKVTEKREKRCLIWFIIVNMLRYVHTSCGIFDEMIIFRVVLEITTHLESPKKKKVNSRIFKNSLLANFYVVWELLKVIINRWKYGNVSNRFILCKMREWIIISYLSWKIFKAFID